MSQLDSVIAKQIATIKRAAEVAAENNASDITMMFAGGVPDTADQVIDRACAALLRYGAAKAAEDAAAATAEMAKREADRREFGDDIHQVQ